MAKFTDRLAHAVTNVFRRPPEEDYVSPFTMGSGSGSSIRPDRNRSSLSNDKTLISSIYNRLAIDVASIALRHVRLDENDQYVEDIKSGLNYCLTTEANLDQAGTQFRQEMAMTLFQKGVIAIVPVETDGDPLTGPGGVDIKTMRVGEIVQWYPTQVRVHLYNERTGRSEDLLLPKKSVAIIENPLFDVMNQPNSNLQRLIRKLNLLDSIDEQTGSGKLDLIIQLPYVIKTEAKQRQAEQRRNDIEMQLKGSKYGIAYTDGTEKVTQLNRPAENNMLAQVESLTALLYAQLGLTEDVFNGTADEKTMLNYHNRTIAPILTAMAEGMQRSFLSKTARSQLQAVRFYRNPFTLMSLKDIAEISDKMIRNEVLSANEIRGGVGFRPSKDPKADMLRNPNMPAPTDSPLPVAAKKDPMSLSLGELKAIREAKATPQKVPIQNES